MFNLLKIFFKNISFNFKTLVRFEFLYKLVLMLILLPIASRGFNSAMHLAGLKYITLENVNTFITYPTTIFLLFMILMFLVIVMLYDYIANIIIFDYSYHKKKINIIEVFKLTTIKSLKIIKSKNNLIVFYILLMIPFLSIGIGTNIVSSIKVPEFIMSYITARLHLIIIYFGIYIILLFLTCKYLYTLSYLTLEELNIKTASKKSEKLIKGKGIIDLLVILTIEVVYSLLFILFLFIEIYLILFINKFLGNLIVFQSILVSIIWLFVGLNLVLFTVISNSININAIESLYYYHKRKNDEVIKALELPRLSMTKKSKQQRKYINYFLTSLVVIFMVFLTMEVVKGNYNFNIESVKEMEVSAHRGASFHYPENTLASFVEAKRLGADYIELDVHETKDGKLVIIHDNSLKRVAGIKKDVVDMTYDELKTIDVGSHFDPKFKDERILLLSEVLEFAQENKIKLMIEIKKTGKEEHIEKDVIDLVDEYNFKDKCVIASLIYDVIENVKRINPEYKTVYILGFIIGDINAFTSADAFSIETSSINKRLVNELHNSGKDVYAWTVNSKQDINEMIDMHVDNIVTDNIDLSKEVIRERRNSNIVNRLIVMLED